MKLRAPRRTNRKLRIGIFGTTAVGKTHFALSGPGPVIIYDSEDRVDAMSDQFPDFQVVERDDRNPVVDVLSCAYDAKTGKDPCGTFIIDSYTTIEKWFRKNAKIVVEQTGGKARASQLGDLRMAIENDLLNPLFTGHSECHLVAICHSANVWQGQQVVGQRADATRNFPHYFDLVFHMERDPVHNASAPFRSTARVIKSNYQSEFPVGRVIENLNWSHFARIINNEVTIEAIPLKQIVALYERAGKPSGSLGAWLLSVGIPLNEAKKTLTPDESQLAKGLLESLIEDAPQDIPA